MTDLVNHPDHYKTEAIECIAAIEAQMTPEEFAGYLRGNVVKYIWRFDKKHGKDFEGAQRDLEKAAWYLHRLTQFRLRTWGVAK
jgi:hypothetical protein